MLCVVSERVALITVDDLAERYDFGPQHPLRPERVLLTYERIRALGLIDGQRVAEVHYRVARDDEIARVHDEDFIAVVKGLDAGEVAPGRALRFGLGTPDDPIFPDMHVASGAVAGASLSAAEALLEGGFEHSFNPAGGLHHARRREASGFCIYNDPAVAIAHVLELRPDWRVMYVDVDVHHGDGVQWIFYDEPRVLTVSLHQSGHYLYPGTGFENETGAGAARGTAINVPLLPYTGDADYLYALERVVRSAAEAFRPDLLLTQLGADTHHGDPLASLTLTMRAYPRIAALLHEVAHRHCAGRWLATGGGGYQATTVVPKVWTIHFAEMCGRPEAVPADWLEDLDPEAVSEPYRQRVEAAVEAVLSDCLPRLAALAG